MASSSPSIERILEHVKTEIKRRGFTYQDVGKALGLSVASVKRLLNSGQISLDKLAVIADMLGETVETLLVAASAPDRRKVSLTEVQEKAFTKNLPAFSFFLRIQDGESAQKITKDTGISQASMRAYLRFLENIKLVEVLPGDKVRSILPRARLYFIPNGPLNAVLFPKRLENIRRQIEKRGQPNVLQPASEQGWLGRYMTLALSRDHYYDLLADMSALLDSYDQLARYEKPSTPLEIITAQCFIDRFDMYDGVLSPISEFEG